MRSGTIPECQRAALYYASDFHWKLFPARMESTKGGGTKKYSWLSKAHAPSGENWGMTNDTKQLKKNFDHPRWRLKCGIGLPTGADNEVFVIEYDTVKGHGVDGKKALSALEKAHGKLPDTLMSKSPTGSIHRFYKHPGKGIKLKSMSIAAGVDVKADGGMVVIPPSVRHDGRYEWIDLDQPIAEPPQWLIDMVIDEARGGNGFAHDDPFNEPLYEPLTEEEKTEGCLAIGEHLVNNDDDWDTWNTNGLKIFNTVPDDRGLKAFHGYSSRSDKYDANATDKKWAAFFKSPPTNLTDGSFNYLVQQSQPEEDSIDTAPVEEWPIKSKQKTDGQAPKAAAKDLGPPVDLWGTFNAPDLPRGLLPPVIEKYAFAHAEQMGSDPAGFAMGALVACATVIPDKIIIQPKKHDPSFVQSARLWVALVGRASALKSPIFRVVMRAIARIDDELAHESMEAIKKWEQLEPKDKKSTPKPPFRRLAMEDVTIEAAQEIAADNEDGLIMSRDELSGFFGSMEQYSAKKGGASSARPFWLKSYDGDKYTLDRISRGHLRVHLSVNIFGGIQPDILRGIAWGNHDDGLIERLLCIMLRKSGIDQDIPLPPEAKEFDALIHRLYRMRKTHSSELVKLDDDALLVREELAREHQLLIGIFEHSNKMLASHIGKFNGLFARLCLLWHVIEHHEDAWQADIDGDTARRVARFMHEFLWHHSVAFYFGTLNVGGEHDKLIAVAGWILAREKKTVTNRDVQASLNTFRDLKQREITGYFEQLQSLGWLERVPPSRAGASPSWAVNAQVHELYKERAKQEAERRAIAQAKLIERKVFHNLDRFKERDKNRQHQQ